MRTASVSNHLFTAGLAGAEIPVGATAPNRIPGIMLPGKSAGEAHPETAGKLRTPPMMPEEKLVKANGAELGVPSKFADCASEMVGASLIASFSLSSFAL